MSILIKGMEMPKSCKDCPCHKFAYDNWDRPYNYCGVTGGVTLVIYPVVLNGLYLCSILLEVPLLTPE